MEFNHDCASAHSKYLENERKNEDSVVPSDYRVVILGSGKMKKI